MSELPDEDSKRSATLRFLRFRLSELRGPPTLHFARGVYHDVLDIGAPDESVLLQQPDLCQRFIDAMHTMAQDGDLTKASAWKTTFAHLGAQLPPAIPEFVSWEAVEGDVTKFLDDLRVRLELYLLKDSFLPTWAPPESWKAVVCHDGQTMYDYLCGLQIPTTSRSDSDSTPNLLVYRLGDFKGVDNGRMFKRVAQVLGGENRILVNASGSGKTRLLFEALSLHWGFYLTCAADPEQNPSGSVEMTNMFDPDFVSRRRSPEGYAFREFDGTPVLHDNVLAQLAANVAIIETLARLVLLARLLIFRTFLDVFEGVKTDWARRGMGAGAIEHRARRAWVLLQVFPSLGHAGDICGPLSGSGASRDIFDALTKLLYNLDHTACQRRIDALMDDAEISRRPRLLVFDEVQVAANRWTMAFNGGTGRQNLGRPLLKPLANGIWTHLPDAHVLVAGTELNKHYVEQALSSNIFKKRAGASQFSDFGGNFRENDMWEILRHFLPEPFICNLPDALKRAILYWLRGRHRFLTTFIEWVLQQGPGDAAVSNVINNIVYAAAGEKIRDFPFTKLHLRIRSLVPDDFPPVSSFGKRVMMSDTRTIRIVRRGILSFLCHSEFPKYSAQKLDLIANGIGRFIVRDDDESIQISERLVLCSLMKYFNHPRNPVGLRVRINEQHSKLGTSEQAAGYGFEDASSYLFYNAFTGPDDQPTPLLDVFVFQRSDDPNNKYDLTPEWAHCSAHLVRTWHTSTPEQVQRNLTAVISTKAHNVPETLAWFMDENRAPFLKPDEHFGSDIIFVLRLCDPTGRFHGKLLFVSVTCKAWKNRHGGLKVKKPLFTSSPEGYFFGLTESKERARMEILNVLRAYFPPLSGNKRPKEKEADDESEDDSDPEEDAPPVPLPLPHDRAPAKGKAKNRAKDAKTAPNPKPKSKPKPKKYVYGDTVDFAVLRVVACYPRTFKLADPPTTSQGLYPLAMLSEKIMQLGCSFGFDAFEEAMERVGMKPDLDDEQILEEENAAFILPETIQLNRPEEEGVEDDDEGAKSDDSLEQFFEWSTVEIKKLVEADYPIEKVPLSSRAKPSAAPTRTRTGDPSTDMAKGEPSGVRYSGANAGMDVEGSNKDGEDLEAADDDSNFHDDGDGDSNFHDDDDSNFHDDDDFRIYADAKDGYNEDGDADNEREDGDEYELASDYEEEEKERTYEGDPEEDSAMDLDNDAVGASQPTVLDAAVAGLELDSDDAWGTQDSEEEVKAPRAQSVKRKASPGIDQDRVFRRRRDE